MTDIIQLVFYSDAGSALNNWALMGFRVLLCLELYLVHGRKKLAGAEGKPEPVPNPFHFPARLNNLVAIFSDTIVPFLVMAGIATRLMVLPVIAVTAVGYLVVHRYDSAQERDIPYMYTISFLLLLFLGPGTISIDHFIWLFLCS